MIEVYGDRLDSGERRRGVGMVVDRTGGVNAARGRGTGAADAADDAADDDSDEPRVDRVHLHHRRRGRARVVEVSRSRRRRRS